MPNTKTMSKMKEFIDDYGVLADGPENSRDGGDSLHRTMLYFYCIVFWEVILKRSTDEFVDLQIVQGTFQRYDGRLRRHPNNDRWWSDWEACSRDNATMFLIGGIIKKSWIKLFVKDHAKRFFLWMANYRHNHSRRTWEEHKKEFPNDSLSDWKKKNKRKIIGDITLFEFNALWARGLQSKWLRPLVYLGDLETLISTYILKWFRKKEKDVINHTVISIYIYAHSPTFLSRLNAKVLDWDDMYKRLELYFSKPGDNFYFLELLKPMIDKMKNPAPRDAGN